MVSALKLSVLLQNGETFALLLAESLETIALFFLESSHGSEFQRGSSFPPRPRVLQNEQEV